MIPFASTRTSVPSRPIAGANVTKADRPLLPSGERHSMKPFGRAVTISNPDETDLMNFCKFSASRQVVRSLSSLFLGHGRTY